MNIENKMAQLTIRKQKILEMINGINEEISEKLEYETFVIFLNEIAK